MSEPKFILKMIPGEEFHQNVFGNKCKVQTWFDATLVYRFNECKRRSYNS